MRRLRPLFVSDPSQKYRSVFYGDPRKPTDFLVDNYNHETRSERREFRVPIANSEPGTQNDSGSKWKPFWKMASGTQQQTVLTPTDELQTTPGTSTVVQKQIPTVEIFVPTSSGCQTDNTEAGRIRRWIGPDQSEKENRKREPNERTGITASARKTQLQKNGVNEKSQNYKWSSEHCTMLKSKDERVVAAVGIYFFMEAAASTTQSIQHGSGWTYWRLPWNKD